MTPSYEEKIVELLEFLERDAGTSYADASYPSSADARLEELSALFAGANQAQRNQLAPNLMNLAPALAAFVQRTASAAADKKAPRKLERALEGLLVAEAVIDATSRRALVGLLGRAAQKAGSNAAWLVDTVGKNPVFAALATDIRAEPWTKPWTELGFRESPSRDGFRYRRWWLRSRLEGWEERLTQVTASLFGHTKGYGLWHLPCQVDENVTEVVEIAAALSPFERPAVGKAFSQHRGILRAFATRMATLAVREGSEERLRAGLSALVIENFADDARETLMELALLFDASRRIGVDPGQAFSEALRWARADAAGHLRAFLARDPGLQRIESMGYSTRSDRDGFVYWHEWTKAQTPGANLCPYQAHASTDGGAKS